ncbi:MAG: T9SS type A sorting domain-containing protein [Flavobacteriales bacterium]|jgi:hypothetical protein|nr:T9SS type A sorting domain-containing protein [Flavobacteriales bacterium]MBP9160205.1 T9SS type A sorting domain-containing protein [Flavobacteriales bacterium]MCI1753418.1 T9SS type A sorting domain-containing protein [Flavobacteriales bacterium]
MKHITLLAAMAVTTAAVAQREAAPMGHFTAPHFQFNADRTPTDTLVPASFMDAGSTLTVYGVTDGGYVAGTNAYGDLAKVQNFETTGAVFVEQILLGFGAKDENGSPNSLLHVRVYGLDGPGTNSLGDATNAPSTIMANVDIPVSSCDTAGITVATFNPAVAVNGAFGAGIDFTALAAGVELGLITTTDGDMGTADDQNWELWSDNTWFTLTAAWPLNLDMLIWPVIGDGIAGINDNATVNNMRMSFIGSNPADKNITVAYEMLQAANARLIVLDGKGAKVVDQKFGQTATGMHQSELNVSEWSNGTYYVSILANGNPITKKLVVQH